MASGLARELLLIRHAPARDGGCLAGRRDVAADTGDAAALAHVRRIVGDIDRLVVSPALRCRQTATALWPDQTPTPDVRLWEQDFGAWEGLAYADIPDLGSLTPTQMAAHTPSRGESFADVCARVAPALDAIADTAGRIAVVAHAGTVRAALAMALGSAGAALAFRIDPLSVTRLIPCGDERGRQWAVGGVNL